MGREITCVLGRIEAEKKKKLLEKMLRFIELEEKYPGYHAQYDVADFLAEFKDGEG
jgi:hypothetical protein